MLQYQEKKDAKFEFIRRGNWGNLKILFTNFLTFKKIICLFFSCELAWWCLKNFDEFQVNLVLYYFQ